jgi:hypothetical protein
LGLSSWRLLLALDGNLAGAYLRVAPQQLGPVTPPVGLLGSLVLLGKIGLDGGDQKLQVLDPISEVGHVVLSALILDALRGIGVVVSVSYVAAAIRARVFHPNFFYPSPFFADISPGWSKGL